MSREPFIPPFFVMPMPLNEFGQGPETDPSKIVKTTWEVWDQTNRTVSYHNTKEDAEKQLEPFCLEGEHAMGMADDLRLGVELHLLCGFISSWSEKTFGPASERGPVGPLKHLAKEAKEASDNPEDKVEYADCLIILLDACWRAGITPWELVDLAHRKMDENYGRKWTKPAGPDEPIEHDRSAEL